MAKKSMILKQQAEPKFSTRRYNRCKICGRPHAYLRDYGVCRICFRELAYKGQIPGVTQGQLVMCHTVRNPNVKKIQRVPGRWLRVRAERIPRIPLGLHG